MDHFIQNLSNWNSISDTQYNDTFNSNVYQDAGVQCISFAHYGKILHDNFLTYLSFWVKK